jgi:hypothetical protein
LELELVNAAILEEAMRPNATESATRKVVGKASKLHQPTPPQVRTQLQSDSPIFTVNRAPIMHFWLNVIDDEIVPQPCSCARFLDAFFERPRRLLDRSFPISRNVVSKKPLETSL